MEKKAAITIILCGIIIVMMMGLYYTKTDKYKISELKRELVTELNLGKKITLEKGENGELCIRYDSTNAYDLYRIQKFLNTKMQAEGFWMSSEKCVYEIQILGERKGMFGWQETGLTIRNINPINQTEYTDEGIYMRMNTEFELPDDVCFEDVKYVTTMGYGIIDYSSLVYFPNLIYLSLNGRTISQELFDHIKSMVPENCEIVNYYIDEGRQ